MDEAASIIVHHAVFGTQSNGSDVRLLARPSGLELSEVAAGAIEAFFYPAWQAVESYKQPYFAFIRLSRPDGLWGLCQVRHLGRGAVGEVVAAWVAVMDEASLEAIGWKTHRLFGSAFPARFDLPESGTLLPPHRATVLAGDVAPVRAYDEAFDAGLYAMNPATNWEHMKAAALIVDPPTEPGLTALSPEGALLGLWDRLGAMRNVQPYCTWAGLEAFGYPGDREPFTLVLARAPFTPVAIPDRLTLRIGATHGPKAPPLPPSDWALWELNRHKWAKVAPLKAQPALARKPSRAMPLGPDLLPDIPQKQGLVDVARAMLRPLVPTLYDRRDFSAFKTLASEVVGAPLTEHTALAVEAMPITLEVVVRGLAANGRPVAASAIDAFVLEALPQISGVLMPVPPEVAVAVCAIRTRLLPLLSPAALAALGPILFGDDPERPDLTAAVLKMLAEPEVADDDLRGLLEVSLNHFKPTLSALIIALAGRTLAHPDGWALTERAIGVLTFNGDVRGAVSVLELSFADAPSRIALLAALRKRLWETIDGADSVSAVAAHWNGLFTLLAHGERLEREIRKRGRP